MNEAAQMRKDGARMPCSRLFGILRSGQPRRADQKPTTRVGIGMRKPNMIAIFAGCLVLAGCTTKQPSPEIIAASTPGPDTPSLVSGPQLEECVTDRKLREPYTVDSEGVFEPLYTLAFAERMHNSVERVAAYADRIRAYSVGVDGTNFFRGRETGKIICYYELQDGNLRYLTSLIPDKENRARTSEVTEAVLKAYAIMAGKSVTKVKWFGVYAD